VTKQRVSSCQSQLSLRVPAFPIGRFGQGLHTLFFLALVVSFLSFATLAGTYFVSSRGEFTVTSVRLESQPFSAQLSLAMVRLGSRVEGRFDASPHRSIDGSHFSRCWAFSSS
jgi:hypothetical protein